MSQVIKLIEQLGASSSAQGKANYQKAIAESGLSQELQQTLLNNEQQKLIELLGAQSTVCSVFLPADDEQPSENDQESPEEQDSEGN